MGLVGFRRSLAGRLLLGLLALPAGAGKGVDGVVAGNLHRLGLGVHPQSLPVHGSQACFKGGFAPGAGLVVLVPQPDPPGPAHPGPRHGGGLGVHAAAHHLAALPQGSAVGGQPDFIGGLAQPISALPGQKQRAAVHSQGARQVIGL